MATYRTAFLTLPLAVASLAFAACGGGDPDPASASDSRAELRKAGVQFAKCMREHGIDMEDPTAGGGIRLQAGPATGNNPEEMEAAQEACQKYLEKVRPPEISEEDQREFRERALKFAQCMREHGIDMPDPSFGSGGGGAIQQRLPDGENPESPRFQEAAESCSKYQPRMQMRDEQ